MPIMKRVHRGPILVLERAYLIPFDSLAAREKAWNAFAADEEWIRVRKESIDRKGRSRPG